MLSRIATDLANQSQRVPFCDLSTKHSLGTKSDFSKMNVSSVGLGSNPKLFVNENLTPYNQKLS